jgi:hypothetical protein
MKSFHRAIVAALVGLVWSCSSQAGLLCADSYANATIQNLGCELGTTNNDSETQVNIDLLFGFDDWEYIWRDEDGPPLPDGLVDWEMDASLLSGSFSIDWADPAQGDVMFVLKDGNGEPDTYVSWLLDPGTFGLQDYAFNTPFTVPGSDSLKQISHGTFYYRDGGPTTRCLDCEPRNEVPEPGPLFLIGAGLLAMRATVKRHQRA